MKQVQNLKNTIRFILWLCVKTTDKKPEDPTEVLAWKVSLPLLSNKAIDKSLKRSIKKVMLNNEKDINMNFVIYIMVGKTIGDALSFPDGYGK